ncbi:MAG: carboxypeptidase regulatory-like domain-containing protein [Nevskia sp.]|nr:carboxypeptidase regulatory-like domain-containing protein [Nevskia sp.]
MKRLTTLMLGLPLLLYAVAASAMMCDSAAGGSELLPVLKQEGAVRYRSGGVGVDEAKAMRADSAHFPLTLVFVARAGAREHYTAAVDVTVAGPAGAVVLQTRADGPFLLVDLPPGTYRVSAVSAGQSKTRSVQLVAGKHQRLVFAWTLHEPAAGP